MWPIFHLLNFLIKFWMKLSTNTLCSSFPLKAFSVVNGPVIGTLMVTSQWSVLCGCYSKDNSNFLLLLYLVIMMEASQAAWHWQGNGSHGIISRLQSSVPLAVMAELLCVCRNWWLVCPALLSHLHHTYKNQCELSHPQWVFSSLILTCVICVCVCECCCMWLVCARLCVYVCVCRGTGGGQMLF